MSKFYFHVE